MQIIQAYMADEPSRMGFTTGNALNFMQGITFLWRADHVSFAELL